MHDAVQHGHAMVHGLTMVHPLLHPLNPHLKANTMYESSAFVAEHSRWQLTTMYILMMPLCSGQWVLHVSVGPVEHVCDRPVYVGDAGREATALFVFPALQQC